MSIYTTEFQPTYLCIKQHSLTKRLYLCKTTRSEKEMLKYTGSGTYWKSHINKHGKEFVETIWYCLFYDKEMLMEFSLMCSNQWDIVNTKDVDGNKIWANLIIENGLDGRPNGIAPPNKGIPQSEYQKQLHSFNMKGVNKGRKLGPQSLSVIAEKVARQTGKKRGPYNKRKITT